ncbi:isoleucyl-tRNA synthetase [Staphylococcus aureus]|uniref:Isoleucyl-tRNA synthetase n=1 Tax=Staphylococcus aureus TaxID=1280 RepID=A0A380DZ31_STAAU|nr:isoleucyl-tRNA synthetase [Staphylococcus aureus]
MAKNIIAEALSDAVAEALDWDKASIKLEKNTQVKNWSML